MRKGQASRNGGHISNNEESCPMTGGSDSIRSSKKNQAPKGSRTKIKGSDQKFCKKGSSTKGRGFTWPGGSFFCFGDQIPYFDYKGSSFKRRGFT